MQKAIWLLLDSRGPGGIETHVFQLAQGLQRAARRVKVVFLTDFGQHPLKDALAACDMDFASLDGGFLSLRQALSQERPWLIHTHGYKAGIYGRLAARLAGVRVVSTYHSGEIGTGRLALYDWLDRHTAGLAKHVFAVSRPIAQRIPHETQVLDNFIDTGSLVRSTGHQIAFVGRLSEEKGADRFLQLAREYPHIMFHLYGDGPLGASLRAQAPENAIFHGQQNRMDKVWEKIGLLIMPSRYEGLPMAALEAMGRGIPLIASHVGALPDFVRNGVNGWLVDQDTPGELKGRTQEWLAMPLRQREQLRTSAAETIRRGYSTEAVIPGLLQVYE